jgi:hypothetical protein
VSHRVVILDSILRWRSSSSMIRVNMLRSVSSFLSSSGSLEILYSRWKAFLYSLYSRFSKLASWSIREISFSLSIVSLLAMFLESALMTSLLYRMFISQSYSRAFEPLTSSMIEASMVECFRLSVAMYKKRVLAAKSSTFWERLVYSWYSSFSRSARESTCLSKIMIWLPVHCHL